MRTGAGMEKSCPFSAAEGVSTSSAGSTGMRSPWLATDLLVVLSKTLAAWRIEHPESPTDRAAAMVRARTAAPELAKAL